MTSIPDSPRPSLIVVTGAPGSGKTTLVHPLAQAVRCPAVCRDEIKEGLVIAAGEESEDLVQKAYGAFFDVVGLLLDRSVTVIAEAAFQHARWAPKLGPLAEIADVRIVVCRVEPEVARRRREERDRRDPERAWFHPDRTPSAADGYDPPFESIVAFARTGRL